MLDNMNCPKTLQWHRNRRGNGGWCPHENFHTSISRADQTRCRQQEKQWEKGNWWCRDWSMHTWW